jgi:hypothetical protein
MAVDPESPWVGRAVARAAASPVGADRVDRARALTVLTPLRWYGPLLLRVRFVLTRLFPCLVKIASLRSIYFTQWTILTSIPRNGRSQPRPRAGRSLLWETNFSAPMDPYIEAFVRSQAPQIRRLWGSSRGFPGTKSATVLRRYIEGRSFPGGYWYSAYPAASVRMVTAALAVSREHEFLEKVADRGSPEDFATAYQGFLRRRQGDL